MGNRTRVAVEGPLGVHIAGFGEELAGQGYAPKSASQVQAVMAGLSGWLAGRELGGADLTEAVVAEFLSARRAAGETVHVSRRGVSPMIDYLRAVGAAPGDVVAEVVSPVDVLIERYVGYMVTERGLARSTVVGYTRTARSFLGCCPVMDGDGFDLGGLLAGDVTGYVLARCQGGPVAYTKTMSSPLRCLLRFLFVEGLTERDLSGAVPSAPDRRLNSLPKAVDAADVARLLESCDPKTVAGRRDFAMITVLSRLGLRAGETAALLVSDIDWRRGELVVRGKANRIARLPLPVDVGEAVVAWLEHGRPRVGCRYVFTRLRAPVGPLSNAAVSMVVSRACQRAGLPVMHAHRLRHTVATETLRSGGSLLEVSQLLRHSNLGTTTIYARVDRNGLSAVVRPWPKVQS